MSSLRSFWVPEPSAWGRKALGRQGGSADAKDAPCLKTSSELVVLEMLVGVATALAAASLTAKGDHIQYLMPCMHFHVSSVCAAYGSTMSAHSHCQCAPDQKSVAEPQLPYILIFDAFTPDSRQAVFENHVEALQSIRTNPRSGFPCSCTRVWTLLCGPLKGSEGQHTQQKPGGGRAEVLSCKIGGQVQVYPVQHTQTHI